MADKVRKLTLKERIEWYKQNLSKRQSWESAVEEYVLKGYEREDAIVAALDWHSVPKMGRTVVRNSQTVKVI